MTSSLDAGVKIYSYRVDNVHSDTLKMATCISITSNKKDYYEGVEDEQTADEKTKKRKLNRKVRFWKIVSVESGI